MSDVFAALWNHEGSREKCRAVLDAICEYMLADSKERGEDAVERRFYVKGDGKDVLPWAFYGELAEKDGEVTNADRIAALKEECAIKKDGDHHARIGF